jgi:hypothetical protein
MSNENKMTVDETVEALKETTKILEESNRGMVTGACLFVAPNGTSWCNQLTPELCASAKGVYIGGPCT